MERLRGRQDAADGVARARPDDVDLVPPAGADADAQRRPPERPVGPAHGPAVGDVEPRDDHEGRVGVQPERVVHRQREHDALLVLVAPREREVDARRVARGASAAAIARVQAASQPSYTTPVTATAYPAALSGPIMYLLIDSTCQSWFA